MNTTEEYKGCRNCKYQPEPMQTCDWLKHQKKVYVVCPMWELKENKGNGDVNNDLADSRKGKYDYNKK